MNVVDQLFDLLDEWRHLPSYQLERRADVFFALFLPRVVQRRFGMRFYPDLIPEFPVHKATLYPGKPSNQSFKIDYVAVSQDHSKSLFIELKTDTGSRRSEQDEYLMAARDVGVPKLIRGLLRIFAATKEKRKYYHLFCLLERVDLIRS